MIEMTVIDKNGERVAKGASVIEVASEHFGDGVQILRDLDESGPDYVTWTVSPPGTGRTRVLGRIVAPPSEEDLAVAFMSRAARDAIQFAAIEESKNPDELGPWVRTLRVTYRLVEDPEFTWRPAREGEMCGAGAGRAWTAGGRGGQPGCGRAAVVTREKPQNRRSFCAEHAGGRLPLADGRVIEPVSNPLGGA